MISTLNFRIKQKPKTYLFHVASFPYIAFLKHLKSFPNPLKKKKKLHYRLSLCSFALRQNVAKSMAHLDFKSVSA